MAAQTPELNRNTVHRYYQMFRDCLTRDGPEVRRLSISRKRLFK